MSALKQAIAVGIMAMLVASSLVSVTPAQAAGKITVGTAKIQGTAVVGGKLTATPTKWKPAKLVYTYQWYRAGVKIANATKRVYRPTYKDLGKKLQLKITAHKKGYRTKSRMLGLVSPIGYGRIIPGLVAISSACVGNAVPRYEAWPNLSYLGTRSYQWLRNGYAILALGADTSGYEPTAADRGQRLSVRITASQPGYRSTTVTSNSVLISC